MSNGWSREGGQNSPFYAYYGPERPDHSGFESAATSAGIFTSSGWKYSNYYGDQLVYNGGGVPYTELMNKYFNSHPWWDDSSGGSGSGSENDGYNDSSFKSLISELFSHLFDVLLYGEDEDYDGTDVDDSIEWLDDLSEDMEDITDKLNQAPTYISNGFTAINNAQSGINDFFTGISTAVPVLYYGIVGILNIIIIRKIIGR